MPSLTQQARRVARGIRRGMFLTPERAVCQRLEQQAVRNTRYTPGHVEAGPYRIAYGDAISVWPQWEEIFLHETLAFETSAPQPRILDCGANVGIASLFFKRRYPRARVTAFEADPEIADICRRNLTANDAADVEVVAAAVWTSRGTTDFVCEGSDSGSVASLGVIAGKTTRVPTIRLRDYLQEPVDLVKLDIEGAEVPVLEDCADALASVRAMTIDLHEFDPHHRQTGRIFDLLTAAGFTFELRNLALLHDRAPAGRSPFAGSAPAWAITVRAWRN
jgi:FkbM family methyltransferase